MTEPQKPADTAERREFPRRSVEIPATIKSSALETTIPLELRDSTIRDVGEGGTGLSLTLETRASALDLSKIFANGHDCGLTCKLPGKDHACALEGTIAWSSTEETDRGLVVRMGIDLRESKTGDLGDLKAYVAKLAGQSGGTKEP